MSFIDYYRLISRAKPQIETFTHNHRTLPNPHDVEASLRKYEGVQFQGFMDVERYLYMVHLRHHGFPPPLLDWSRSPYIAAFRHRLRPRLRPQSHQPTRPNLTLRALGKGAGRHGSRPDRQCHAGRRIADQAPVLWLSSRHHRNASAAFFYMGYWTGTCRR
jgi:hypothetical protein